MLKIKNLTIKNKEKILVNNLNLIVKSDDIFALVGTSGSGKSLTALSILGLLAKTLTKSGQIEYQGKTNLTQLRGREIGFIFQDPSSSLNPVFSIGYQLLETIKRHKKISKKEAKSIIYQWLVKVGLNADFYHRYPHQCSGGQIQRVMIALSLVSGAKLLIADEPTTALDFLVQKQILELLFELKQHNNLSILLITHDLSLVKNIANKVAVMRDGCVIEQGSLEDIIQIKNNYIQTLLLGLKPQNRPLQSKQALLRLNQLGFSYQQQRFFWQKTQLNPVLSEVSFNLNEGDNLAIVGESGSGKTTLAKLITKQLQNNHGRIDFYHQNTPNIIKNINQKTYAANVQMVFQNVLASFNPRQTLAQTLLEGMYSLGVANANQTYLEGLFEEVGLEKSFITRLPHQLSGGQLQRASIVRALCVNPKIIICDEPTSALDNILKKQVLDLLLSLQEKHNISYILITHDMDVVRYFSNQVVVLKQGKIIEQGDCQTMLNN